MRYRNMPKREYTLGRGNQICLPQSTQHFIKKRVNKQKKKIRSNGLVVRVLDSQLGLPYSKPLGGSKIESAFHPSRGRLNEYQDLLKT